MFGIVLKDMYETFCIKKNTLAFIASFLLMFVMTITNKSAYFYFLMVGILIPFLSSAPLQYSMEQDETSQFNQILLTYPLTKREIITMKYLSCILFTLGSWVISFILFCIYTFIYHSMSLQHSLYIYFFGCILSIALLAIFNTGFYILGTKKGNIMYGVGVVIFVIFHLFGWILASDITYLVSIDINILLIIGLIISLILLLISYLLSIKIYAKRYS